MVTGGFGRLSAEDFQNKNLNDFFFYPPTHIVYRAQLMVNPYSN